MVKAPVGTLFNSPRAAASYSAPGRGATASLRRRVGRTAPPWLPPTAAEGDTGMWPGSTACWLVSPAAAAAAAAEALLGLSRSWNATCPSATSCRLTSISSTSSVLLVVGALPLAGLAAAAVACSAAAAVGAAAAAWGAPADSPAGADPAKGTPACCTTISVSSLSSSDCTQGTMQ